MQKSYKAAGFILLLGLLSACPSEQAADRSDNNDMQTQETRVENTQTTTQSQAQTDAVPAKSDDAAGFLARATQGGGTEIQIGKLALEKSTHADVKSFAQHLITDHTQAGKEVEALAKTKQISLPTQVAVDQQSVISKLSSLKGAEFDKVFIDENVRLHQQVIQDFQQQSADNQDPDARKLAAKTLPKLQAHLKMAEDLQAKIK